MRRQHFLVIGLFVFILDIFFFEKPLFSEDDVQYWSRFAIKPVDTRYVDYVNFWDLRFFEDISKLGFWYTSQKIQIDPMKHVGFVMAHTYLESEVANARRTQNEFKYQHRLELEANPYWQWGNRLHIKNRNRMEFRWMEDRGSDNGRFRHLWQLEVPIKKVPFLKSVYASNEIFYEFEREKFAENWVTPVGLKVPIYKKTSLQLFYLIQSRKGAKGDWSSNQVLGTHLDVAF